MKRNRTAYSLIEMLVVMSLLSVVLGAIGLIMNTAYRTNQHMQKAIEYREQLDRFATRFRSDVHQAASVAMNDKDGNAARADRLTLTLSNGQTIEYRLGPDRVERFVRRGTKIEHYDTFQITPSPANEWTINRERICPLVSLVMQRASKDRRVVESGGTIYLTAAAGLIHSHVLTVKASEED